MIRVNKIWITESAVWIRTEDGREAFELFSDYPRLYNASDSQRSDFVSDSFGISWPDLDEDLCFEGFFKKKTKNDLYRIFMSHPELNAAGVARRVGISQSLFAQYISGIKKPSEERKEIILGTIRQIGKELSEL
ncbi:MAG: DUF2442 domain-containing protein [Bacteroidales bacterium]|nr:DUF2442 domain-containing protein [Bacteroidales bacterium]